MVAEEEEPEEEERQCTHHNTCLDATLERKAASCVLWSDLLSGLQHPEARPPSHPALPEHPCLITVGALCIRLSACV